MYSSDFRTLKGQAKPRKSSERSKYSCSWKIFKTKFIQWLYRVFNSALLLFVLPSKSFRFTWRHVFLSFSNERLLMPSGGTHFPSPRQRTERPEHDNYHGRVQVKRAVNHMERRLVILAHCITGLDQWGRRRNPPQPGPAVLRPDWSVLYVWNVRQVCEEMSWRRRVLWILPPDGNSSPDSGICLLNLLQVFPFKTRTRSWSWSWSSSPVWVSDAAGFFR